MIIQNQNVTLAYVKLIQILKKTSELVDYKFIMKEIFYYVFFRVVTGVGLVKNNHLVQLVISQRTLLPYGQTRADESNTWKFSKRQFNITNPSAIPGHDYHILTYENRSIALNAVTAPENKVVTGVRFRVIDGVLTLQIRVTDFSYHSGQLEHLEYTEWLPKTIEKGDEILLEKPGNPILSSEDIDVPNSGVNRFVQFGPTDVFKDASQLTVSSNP